MKIKTITKKTIKKIKTFTIITFGCRVNQAESRQMGESLTKLGLVQEKNYQKANLIIINTCTITHKADREIRKEIRKVKRNNPNCFLIVTGCWADKQKISQQQDKKPDNQNLLNQIDLLLTNQQKLNLNYYLKKYLKPEKTKLKPSKDYQDKYYNSNKAIVKIQDGCNNFCTYCIVPLVRGRSKSKPIKTILTEIKELERKKIKEVILTGIDLQDFKTTNKKEQSHLSFLLKQILNQTKIEKISFGSMGLKIFDDKFLSLYKTKSKRQSKNKKTQPKLTTHFHIPLQSGDNQTLKRMGRNYTKEEFLKKIKRINKKIKKFTFSTDIIVGFPGETAKEFEQTKKTIKNIKKLLKKNFKHMHIFRYSQRQGTIASSQIDKKHWQSVKEKEKAERLKEIKNF